MVVKKLDATTFVFLFANISDGTIARAVVELGLMDPQRNFSTTTLITLKDLAPAPFFTHLWRPKLFVKVLRRIEFERRMGLSLKRCNYIFLTPCK